MIQPGSGQGGEPQTKVEVVRGVQGRQGPEGRRRLRRVTSRRDGGDRVELEVSNSGPVVPPYEIPALFEPFRRLDTDRLITAKGTGLGLSIVLSIARAHDGEVTARAREEGGLTVTVTLPACPHDSTTEQA